MFPFALFYDNHTHTTWTDAVAGVIHAAFSEYLLRVLVFILVVVVAVGWRFRDRWLPTWRNRIRPMLTTRAIICLLLHALACVFYVMSMQYNVLETESLWVSHTSSVTGWELLTSMFIRGISNEIEAIVAVGVILVNLPIAFALVWMPPILPMLSVGSPAVRIISVGLRIVLWITFIGAVGLSLLWAILAIVPLFLLSFGPGYLLWMTTLFLLAIAPRAWKRDPRRGFEVIIPLDQGLLPLANESESKPAESLADRTSGNDRRVLPQ